MGKLEGVVESIDNQGNLVTSITAGQLSQVPRGEETLIVCDEHETHGIFSDDHEQPAMTLIGLLGASGKLELSIVGDSAAIMLGVRAGTPVVVSWS